MRKASRDARWHSYAHLKHFRLHVVVAFTATAVASHSSLRSRKLQQTKLQLTAIGDCTATVDGEPASPQLPGLWQHDLSPTFQTKAVKNTYVDELGRVLDFYELDISPVDVQLFPGDSSADTTEFFGYDGMAAAPTIKVCRGRQTMVRVLNNLGNATNPPDTSDLGYCSSSQGTPISLHLHGAATVATYDGWAEDITCPGQYKDYLYPNNRAATQFYHDHTLGMTADNGLRGLAGQYWVKDCSSPAESYYMPRDDYDLPLNLRDIGLDDDYQLFYDPTGVHSTGFYQDINLVNGLPWPFLAVQARFYRLRLLCTSLGRPFYVQLVVEDPATGAVTGPERFAVIGSDSGLRQTAVMVDHIFVGPAERYEILVDFSQYTNRNVYMLNSCEGCTANVAMFCRSHLLMRFQVGAAPIWTADDALLEDRIRRISQGTTAMTAYVPLGNLINPDEIEAYRTRAQQDDPIVDRAFEFGRNDGLWEINGTTFNDTGRLMANPQRDTVELWKLVNVSPLWFHPAHVHLVDFLILRRDNGTTDVYPSSLIPADQSAQWYVRPYEADTGKDVIHLGPTQTVYVLARFGPHDGDYMFHCHNLVHEDRAMMVAMGVGRDSVGLPENQLTFRTSQNRLSTNYLAPVRTGCTDYRLPLADRAKDQTLVPPLTGAVAPLLNQDQYACTRLDSGLYSVFYPDHPPTRLNQTWASDGSMLYQSPEFQAKFGHDAPHASVTLPQASGTAGTGVNIWYVNWNTVVPSDATIMERFSDFLTREAGHTIVPCHGESDPCRAGG